MESIDSEIVHDDYEGLASRDARRRLAKDKYEESKEATELRLLAQAALLKKSKQEQQARSKDSSKEQRPSEETASVQYIEAELEVIAQTLPPEEINACVIDFVQVYIEITSHTSISVKTHFPEDYPDRALFVDVKSKYLDPELLEKLKAAGEVEAKKHIGERQVVAVIDRLRAILTLNRLAPAFSDLKQLKEYLKGHAACSLKTAKEKSGSVGVSLKSGCYFLDLDLTVPLGYPGKTLELKRHTSNLPAETLNLFLTAAKEKARHLAELPVHVENAGRSGAREGAGSGAEAKSEMLSQSQTLASRNRVSALATQAQETQQRAAARRKELEESFVSRPSLFAVVRYLHEECLTPLATGMCRICEKQLLPSDPSLTSKIPKNMVTLKLYCGHMYHFKCVESYVSRPPFGKKCLHCGAKIQHSRLMTDEKILEQRWTHQQARQREIEDVADFMSL